MTLLVSVLPKDTLREQRLPESRTQVVHLQSWLILFQVIKYSKDCKKYTLKYFIMF